MKTLSRSAFVLAAFTFASIAAKATPPAAAPVSSNAPFIDRAPPKAALSGVSVVVSVRNAPVASVASPSVVAKTAPAMAVLQATVPSNAFVADRVLASVAMPSVSAQVSTRYAPVASVAMPSVDAKAAPPKVVFLATNSSNGVDVDRVQARATATNDSAVIPAGLAPVISASLHTLAVPDFS